MNTKSGVFRSRLAMVVGICIGSVLMSGTRAGGQAIPWEVISGGGGRSASADYVLQATIGQTSVGLTAAGEYAVLQGFWTSAGGSTCCVPPRRGNVDGDTEERINIIDLTILVGYLLQGKAAPMCEVEADVNGDGVLNILDCTYLVSYLFNAGPPPLGC